MTIKTTDCYWRLGVYIVPFTDSFRKNKIIFMCLELRLKSDIHLDNRPLKIIDLESCTRESEAPCPHIPVLSANGPFRITCLGCNLSTGPHDTVEELAKEWNKIALVRKVLEDL